MAMPLARISIDWELAKRAKVRGLSVCRGASMFVLWMFMCSSGMQRLSAFGLKNGSGPVRTRR